LASIIFLTSYLSKTFIGSEEIGFQTTINNPTSTILVADLQKHLAEIKRAFPEEGQAVLEISDKVKYQAIAELVTAIQEIVGVALLFPEIVIKEI